MPNKKALALPDALLVRYYKAGELEQVTKVTKHRNGGVTVQLRVGRADRTDRWLELSGGIGYVPDGD